MSAEGKAIFNILSTDLVTGPLLRNTGKTPNQYRVYPAEKPQDDYANNSVVYATENMQGEPTKDGSSQVDTKTVNVMSICNSVAEIDTLKEAVRNALEYKFGEYGGVKVDGCHLDDETSEFDEDVKKHFCTQRYKMRIKRIPQGIELTAEDESALLID
jgi:hypothetical protein